MYVGANLVGKARGLRITRRPLTLFFAMASTFATLALVRLWWVASHPQKGDGPGALLIVAFVPGLMAFIMWSLLLGATPSAIDDD